MSKKITESDDGSHSLFSERYKEQYHSLKGAYTESQYIFIEQGLKQIHKPTVRIFEQGFGTGLNALLGLKHASENPDRKFEYFGIEKYPVEVSLIRKLNYPKYCHMNSAHFEKLHTVDFDIDMQITPNFVFRKQQADLTDFETLRQFDIIWFDAFSPETQPELWTEIIFKKMHKMLNNKGLLLTYSSKGIVKRALRSAGFTIERLPGPPGKRHIIRARKQLQSPENIANKTLNFH